MIRTLNFTQRQAIITLVILHLPFEVNEGGAVDFTNSDNSWREHAITTIAEHLHVPNWNTNEVIPLLAKDHMLSKQEWLSLEQLSLPFTYVLGTERAFRLQLCASLLIYLVEAKQFDGRGSVLVRNLVRTLGLSVEDGILLENQLSLFLVQQYQELIHSKEDSVDTYRYAKIGAAAVGAGALIFFTAGLAAPAVAGALVIMGTSSVAAAGIAGGMVVVFGGTGAGLAGYKMQTRTRGLQEFEFKQYYDKDKMEVMIMVSGWMEEDEDDKRTFGVIPDQLSLLERLLRFYKLHDANRVAKAQNEAECFQDDPEQLFDQMREQYGKDPLDSASLTPLPVTRPLSGAAGQTEGKGPAPAGAVAEVTGSTSNEYLDAITACFESLLAESYVPENDNQSISGHNAPVASYPTSAVAAVPSLVTSTSDAHVPLATVLHTTDIECDDDRREATSPAVVDVDVAQIALLNAQLQMIDTDAASTHDVHLHDQFHYWHWHELTVSPLYELTLLHWEPQLQRDLGKTILNMVKFLGGYAAEVALQYTMLSALVSAIALPVLMINLTSVIDNIWLIAAERATEAGKELARALLERPHGRRPVTLVGYSMGCRVIFSCLKELVRRMEELESEPSVGIPVATPAPTEEPERVVPPQCPTAEPSQGTASSGYFSFGSIFSSAPAADPLVEKSAAVNSTVGVTATTSNAEQPRPGGASSSSAGATAGTTASTAAGPKGPVRTLRDIRSMIKDVVLLGAPLNLNSKLWAKVREVVAGRLVNGYSTSDMILSVIYRYERYKVSVCGIAPVNVRGIENINLTHIVTQHTHYCTKMKEILEEVNLGSSYPHHSAFGVFE